MVSKAKAKSQDRDSLVKLRAHVDGIAKRLDRANRLTRTSIKALSVSYENLKVNHGGEKDSSDVTQQIDALSNHLIGLLEQTRKDVAHDLQIVMADPRMETVGAALTKANRRLSHAEAQQAKAIGEINDHIAKLASALDERMQQEVRAREQAQEALKQDIGERIAAVERTSADAMNLIGDKVVQVSEDLKKHNDDLKREVSEKNLNQQHDYEEHKAAMARRVEALEDDQRNTIPSLERRMVTLVTRIEVLETETAALSEVPALAPPMPPLNSAPAYMASEPVHSATPQIDAFSPSEPIVLQSIAAPENPYEVKAEAIVLEGSVMRNPQPYVPQEYTPDTDVLDVQTAAEPVQSAPSHAPFNVQTGAFEQEPQNYAPPVFNTTPPPMAAMPDTAATPSMPPMAETMGAARPGADPLANTSVKKTRFRKTKTSSEDTRSPLKTALLMSGIAIVSVFAAKAFLPKVMGKKPVAANAARSVTQKPLASATVAPTPQPVINTVAAVGDYTKDMKAPDLGEDTAGKPSQAKITLEAAAASGDAIAQFQLGLSHLEAGRNAEAVRLIRLAASQGQAAAQYRLGKLYESGLGVETDMKTAVQLLEKAAAGGNRIAMHDLGHYRATGADGGAPNIELAVEWFEKAAQRGVLDSQYNLGVLYQGDSGVDANLSESYIWFAIAGAQGDQVALQRKAAVEQELSEEALANAQARVKAFTPKRIDDAANGIFRNLPWARATKTRTSANTSIKAAQELLAHLGYDVGTPDGAIGPRTRNAVIRFERANGLPETGRVNAALIDRLSLAAGA